MKSEILSGPLPFIVTSSVTLVFAWAAASMVLHRNAASGAVYSGSARQWPTLCTAYPTGKAEQARDALIAHGFPEETMQQDDGFSVYVRDPDGNKIELHGKRTEV